MKTIADDLKRLWLYAIDAAAMREEFDNLEDYEEAYETYKKNSIANVEQAIKEAIEKHIVRSDELQGNMSPLQWEIAQDRNALRRQQRLTLWGKEGEENGKD